MVLNMVFHNKAHLRNYKNYFRQHALSKKTRIRAMSFIPFSASFGAYFYKYVIFTDHTYDNCLNKCPWKYMTISTTAPGAIQVCICEPTCPLWTGGWGTEILPFDSRHCSESLQKELILQPFTAGLEQCQPNIQKFLAWNHTYFSY